MEGAKFNKGTTGNNRRFVKNRREDNSYSHPFPQENNPGGKVNSVKPQYVERTKHLEMKPVVDDRKKYEKNFMGGSFHGQQKEHRSSARRADENNARPDENNVRRDENNVRRDDRRKFNYPKEKSNRHFKPRNQSRGTEPQNDETKSRKQTNKNENSAGAVILKRNDNIPNSTPHYLKPAVHVQPLQQVPDKSADSTAEHTQIAENSEVRPSTEGNSEAEGYQEVSNNECEKEPLRSTTTVQETGIVQTPKHSTDSKQDFQKNIFDQTTLDQVRPVFQSEARSLTDLNTSGLGSYLSSSICSSFVPAVEKDCLATHPSSNQNMLQDDCLPPAQHTHSQPNNYTKKFLTENKLTPLLERSRSRDNVKEPLIVDESSEGYQVSRDQAVSHEKVPDGQYGYRISVDSLFSTSFFTSPQAGVNNKREMKEIAPRDPLIDACDNHMVKKCSEEMVSHIPHDQDLNKGQQFNVINPSKMSLLTYPPSLSEGNYKKDENLDPRLISPRLSKGIDKSPTLGSPPPVLCNLAPHGSVGKATALTKDEPFSVETTNSRTYGNFSDEENLGKDARLPTGKMFNREDEEALMTFEKDMATAQERTEIAQEPLPLTRDCSEPDSMVNMNYREIPKHCMSLQNDKFETKEVAPSSAEKTPLLSKTELQSTNTSAKKRVQEQNGRALLNVENNHVHQGAFHQGPFLPNPFLSHSLLTHRQAIPSAFVYPSRVGMSGPGYADDTNPATGTQLFPPHGTTVCLNVGGRIFEILPSTFAPYPESHLFQIFTGAAPAPINQRGHLFFDRDGYLFEIILSFARVGHLTLPPNVNLSSLMNEAKFFGMYESMFQKGQISSGNMLQFQRTTRCTLYCDDSSKTSDTRVFVLQRDDKLKIESLRVSGLCYLYVDLYTPSGVKETSNFVIYTPDKPDLWKAYQFCAERRLVFHLERAHSDTSVKPSVDIVFAQTFVFVGDEFLPQLV